MRGHASLELRETWNRMIYVLVNPSLSTLGLRWTNWGRFKADYSLGLESLSKCNQRRFGTPGSYHLKRCRWPTLMWLARPCEGKGKGRIQRVVDES